MILKKFKFLPVNLKNLNDIMIMKIGIHWRRHSRHWRMKPLPDGLDKYLRSIYDT